MNVRMKQLRDLVVALDRSDRKVQPLSPEAYRAAATEAQRLTQEQMGLLPMSDFAGPVNALQTLAENIFFGFNGDQINIVNAESKHVSSMSAASFQAIGALDEESQEQFIRALSKMHVISYEMGEADGIASQQKALRSLCGLHDLGMDGVSRM